MDDEVSEDEFGKLIIELRFEVLVELGKNCWEELFK